MLLFPESDFKNKFEAETALLGWPFVQVGVMTHTFAKVGAILYLWDQSALLGGDEDRFAAGDERQNLTLWSLTEQHGGLRYRSESSDICLPRSRRTH